MTRPLDEMLWKWDAETFARRRRQYEMFASYHARLTIWNILQRLQARWPNHKLGDMPEAPIDNRVNNQISNS